LSTPPAFILSQDQTLHKSFSKKQGREKPETQPKTNHPTPPHQIAVMLNWHNFQKLQGSTTTDPNPTGQKQGRSQIRELKACQPHPRALNQTDDAIHQWNSTTPPPAHTQKQASTTQCTKGR
ncbi:hypothetical protein ACUY3B_03110, partial [Corynebacterium ureicelerivorans]